VRARTIRERFLREENGFTMIEMMVTAMIMVVVLMALYSIFDMSVRMFSVGSNKVEAAESARLGLEKMEREIRAAYPVDASDPAKGFLFFSANGVSPPAAAAMPTASQITFGNELVGAVGTDTAPKILCGTPCEYITYKLTDDASNAPCTAPPPCTLRRVNTANASTTTGQPVVEDVAINGLTFTYYESDASAANDQTTVPPLACRGTGTTIAECEDEIVKVLVSLQITVDQNARYEATQRLTTEIDLRNR
jgi:prepilin-type N-terminal cleavage/methylation domain-containing protein